MKKLIYIFIVLLLVALAVGNAYAVQKTSITQYGVTWNFSTSRECGQFVTGDWWVVGPVTINSVSPNPTGTRNGSSLNPMPHRQGYDNRGADPFSTVDNVTFPHTFQSNSSLVSSVSKAEGAVVFNWGCMQSQAVLTVVSAVQPAGAFRPGYCGTYKQYFNTSQVNYGLLPNVTKPASAPTSASVLSWITMPHIDHYGVWTIQYGCAQDNWAVVGGSYPCYGRDYAQSIGQAGLYAMLNTPEKNQVVNALIQIGIDNYSVLKAGGDWFGTGGHHNGRKMQIVFAAKLLNDASMLNVGQDYAAPTSGFGFFGEDDQTYTGANGKALFGTDDNPMYFLAGCSGSGPKDARDPAHLVDGCPDYRGNCTSQTWISQMLVTLMIGAKSVWNHNQFFDFVDRYWAKDGGLTEGGTSGFAFTDAMWTSYRNNLPPPQGGGGDTQAPSTPTNLAASNITSSSVTLSWTASTDNVGVTGYGIYKNGVFSYNTGSTATTTIVTGLSASTAYSFYIKAGDAAGNASAASNTVNVTTLAVGSGVTSSTTWQSFTVSTQTGTFTAAFDAVPNGTGLDVITGIQNGTATAYSNQACQVRFNTTNTIDARNGGAYAAATSVGYTSGTNYHFRLVINRTAHTYSIYVTPAGQSEVTVGTNYAFRTEQAGVTQLTGWSLVAVTGTHTVSNMTFTPSGGDTQAPSVPTGLVASNKTQTSFTLSWTASTDNVGVTGYEVFKNGASIGTPTTTSMSVTGLSANTTYAMTVRARDAVPNWSAQSTALNVTTLSSQLINETFTTSPASNFTPGGGTWTVTGGKYVLTNPISGGAGTGNPNKSIHNTNLTGDWTLTVDGSVTATTSAWNDFAVIFGYQDASNYYYVSFNESNDATGSGIFKFAGAVQTQLADITSLITGGTTYAVKITKVGSTYRAYRNTVLMATATDATWSSGKVGFGTLNDGATYDNLVVVQGLAKAQEESFDISDKNGQQLAQPSGFKLQNYPNPFNPTTNLEYQLVTNGFVSLKIFDVLGREVATLVNGQKAIGIYTVQWDASNLPSGVYLSRLTVQSQDGLPMVLTKKLLLAK